MNDHRNAIVDSFRQASIAHFQATLDGRSEDTIVTSDAFESAKRRISDERFGRDELSLMLRDKDRRVRIGAAFAMLPMGNWRAKFELYRLSLFSNDALGLLAKLRLFVWRNEGR